MGFKIKNSLTGEFEKLPILTLKGEKGETGGVEEYNKVDYMGNKYETLKQANDANVEYAVKTAIGEFNYLDYDGQHITATDTIEGRSKSAILTGQTLVNLINVKNATGGITYTTKDLKLAYELPVGKYILFYDIIKANTSSGLGKPDRHTPFITFNDDTKIYQGFEGFNTSKGKKYWIIDAKTPIVKVEYWLANLAEDGEVDNLRLFAYQDGMENWDIPYFEGMQSVKMPVLTTTGKNLLDTESLVEGSYWTATGNATKYEKAMLSEQYIRVKPSTRIYFSYSNVQVLSYDINKKFINRTQSNGTPYLVTDGVAFIRLSFYNTETYDKNIMVTMDETPSPYEPYKTNILTVNEDVTLHGIGVVKDELNLLTGEVTERIGEIVLDGSEDEEWSVDTPKDTINRYLLRVDNLKDVTNYSDSINCDKWRVFKPVQGQTEDQEGIYINGWVDKIHIGVDVSRLSENSLSGFKQWLSDNPLTVQFLLDKEVIKTVDLSDNHVYSYKGTTHYDCSSAEGSLVPTLSVKVPTDVQATIAQQRETIQTLNSENERLNQIQEVLKASMLDSQVQLMNLSWNTDFEVFALRESIAPKDFLLVSRTGSNIDKFSQAKFIIENDCPDLEKLNSQIEYYFSKDVFSQEQFEELTDLISIVKGENGCEY